VDEEKDKIKNSNLECQRGCQIMAEMATIIIIVLCGSIGLAVIG